ncbi:hypothetical protein AV545_04450 [Paenibacillus jamilae]|uniref:hypothetical protein n=1 Tax=Paenibacillus jamilae TaxID=114136 RepID=UPI0007AB2838|nr:hypothetical protein [Paenibacillus jamilae]KZE65180.1 hypothetical protein AV545_04450 [Paenibacillus jamilae]
MPELHTYLELNDPVIMITRKGTPEDPFVNRADSLTVMNGLITLFELPSSAHGVSIAGMTEISQQVFENRPYLNENEFLVQYQTGAIQVHPSLEGTTKLCRYMGKGLVMQPASRIYAMVQRHPDIVKTLQDIVDEAYQRLNDTQLAIGRLEEIIRQSQVATSTAEKAADNANQAADLANSAANKAIDAYKTTRLAFKPYVRDMQELTATYPHPELGWTVQTTKDGIRYRYDGNRWIPIDLFGDNLQPVSKDKDGLMTVALLEKVNDIPLEVQDRVIQIGKHSDVYQEIFGLSVFPFNGEIVEIEAILGVAGDTDTEIAIEKSRDYITWTNILNKNIHFNALEHHDDKTSKIGIKTVNAGDTFRINVLKNGINIQDLNVNIIVRT